MAHTPEHIKAEELGLGDFQFDPQERQGLAEFQLDTPVTGGDLTTTAETDFQTFQDTSVFPVDTLETPEVPEIELTEPEEKAQTFTEQLQELQTRVIGESAFRTEQEEVRGLPGLETTQRDLTSQLQILKNEFAAIPQRLQLESEARGRTVAGLAPLQAGELRKISIQALGVSSLLEASRGNITTALELVDRAVAAKFDPIKEAIAVTQANLDLILESPEFTVAEKNRARKEKAVQDEKKREVDRQERNANTILKIGTEAALRQAPATVLREIQKLMEDPTDENVIKATQLAAPFLQKEAELDTQVVEVGGRKLLINTQTGATIRDLGVVDIPTGVDVQTGISPVTGKAFTDNQAKSATFAVRMTQAEEVLGAEDLKIFSSVFTFLPEIIKSTERKEFEQAEKNFITAQLRKESGAAIAAEEFKDARVVYIPVPGDDADRLKQKALSRQIAITGLINESVGAFEQLQASLPEEEEETPVNFLLNF